MHGTLQLADNERRHTAYWRAQRVGWVCMLLVVLAALAGVFGSGLFSEAEVAGEGVRVKYSRFVRVTTPVALDITLEHPTENATLSISREYLQSFEVNGILPQPVSSRTTREQHVFSFATIPGEPLHVTVQLTPRESAFGLRNARVSTPAGAAGFWQFVWP
jgi:hypothetical protein